jgi:predicted glycosyltransferase
LSTFLAKGATVSAFSDVLDVSHSAGGAGTAVDAAKIWIDLDNSPHVPFFAPILDELHHRGYSTVVTARDCFQVRELADLHGLRYTLIGRHSGKNRIRKITGLCRRALQLAPTVLSEKPDLAVSHGSRAQLMVSASLGIPSLLIGDYEFSTSWMFIQPTWVMTPDVIPTSAVRCDANRILRYPGIKEDVYVPRLVPDPRIRSQLGLDERDLVVTVRPPASEAHYHNPESDVLFEAAVEFLSCTPGVKLVALPRNEKQAWGVRARWPDLISTGQMRIPRHAVDGLNLIWYSDLVISGGGTMNREAAAMGVPVYSVFRGQIGAVDRYLSTRGRLVLLERVQDIPSKIRVVRRDRRALPRGEGRAALASIVTQLTAIVESRCAVPGRDVA